MLLTDSAESLAMLLRHLGHEVRTAYDGEAAFELAANLKPNIGLFDIGMPKLNGYELACRIREQPWGRDMVLIALSGWVTRRTGGAARKQALRITSSNRSILMSFSLF